MMCGLFGWMPGKGFGKTNLVANTAERLSELMRLRGPDDHGWEVLAGDIWYHQNSKLDSLPDVDLLLGQNRLSIIDLSPDGHQPMEYLNGKYRIVFNGEIYNYLELRAELETQGYIFRSQSDTEVLVASYAAWGRDCVLRFTGMFAFAIYDKDKKTLFCARDFFGIKPFYYSTGDFGFAFASELPALLEIPGVSRKINPQKAYDYLRYGFVDIGDSTMLEGVHQLPPAHSMTIVFNGGNPLEIIKERYWHIDLDKQSNLSFNEASVELRRLFLESIKLHLRSDVPLGVALSGGIDSSAVACSIRALYPDLPINTFSYVAIDSDEVSEEKWIDLVNAEIGAKPHKVYVRPEELVNDLDSLIRRLGEPFVSTSIYAQYRVFKLVHESGVTVTLDGQGADELLAGYQGYPAERIESLVRSGHWISAFRFFRETTRWPGRSSKEIIFSVIRRLLPHFLEDVGRKLIGQASMPTWLRADWFAERGVVPGITNITDTVFKSKDKVRAALAHALTVQGLPMLLRHGDRNAMTSSVESRVPFLTREIAEFLLSLPEDFLIDKTGRTKSVFREAMRGIVPDEILDRRDKIGFRTPEKDWFIRLSPWIRDILSQAGTSGLIDTAAAAKEWGEVEAGRKQLDGMVWRWINFLRWKEVMGAVEI